MGIHRFAGGTAGKKTVLPDREGWIYGEEYRPSRTSRPDR
jgi:hypothetical protein